MVSVPKCPSKCHLFHKMITFGMDILRIFDFFSVRSIFISPNEHQKWYFHEWPPRVKIPLLVFMSEIKIDLTLKKSNFLFL